MAGSNSRSNPELGSANRTTLKRQPRISRVASKGASGEILQTPVEPPFTAMDYIGAAVGGWFAGLGTGAGIGIVLVVLVALFDWAFARAIPGMIYKGIVPFIAVAGSCFGYFLLPQEERQKRGQKHYPIGYVWFTVLFFGILATIGFVVFAALEEL